MSRPVLLDLGTPVMTDRVQDWLDFPEPYHAERMAEYLTDQMVRVGATPENRHLTDRLHELIERMPALTDPDGGKRVY
jgi:hypothetical protein